MTKIIPAQGEARYSAPQTERFNGEIAMAEHVTRWEREHANFARFLDLLEAQLALFHRGERPDYDLMLDVMQYMTEYADPFHHAKEDLAFKRLAERDATAGPVVAAVAREHSLIGATGASLVDGLRAVVNGAVMPREAIESQAHSYVDRLRSHMHKEEVKLFPVLATRLRHEDWFLIDAAIHFIADPLFGERSMERYRTVHRQTAQTAGCGCEDVSPLVPMLRSSETSPVAVEPDEG